MGVGLALLAALSNAASSVLQRRAATSAEQATGIRLYLKLLRTPIWQLAIVALILGFLLQAAALSQSSLTLVEPLLIGELPLTILLAAHFFRRRLPMRDWLAVLAVTVGLGVLLGAASPSGGNPGSVPGWRWALCAAAAGGFLGLLVLGALRSRGSRRGALLGAAAGSGFGITAALIKASTARLDDPAALLSSWEPYAMVACGLASLALFNAALHVATLVTVQPAVTLGDPLISALFGITLYGERIRAGWLIVPELAGIGLIVAGTIALAHSSHLQPSTNRSPAQRSEGMAPARRGPAAHSGEPAEARRSP